MTFYRKLVQRGILTDHAIHIMVGSNPGDYHKDWEPRTTLSRRAHNREADERRLGYMLQVFPEAHGRLATLPNETSWFNHGVCRSRETILPPIRRSESVQRQS